MTSPDRRTGHRGRHLLVALLTAALVLLVPTTAFATGEHGSDPDNGTLPQPKNGPTDDSDNTAVGTRGTCAIVSTSSYLGVSCAHGNLGDPKSIKQILHGAPLPDCWNEKMSAADMAALHLQDVSPKEWYWVRCLKGIDPVTLKKTGPVTITVGWWPYGPEDHIVTLHGGQVDLVDFFSKDEMIPYPLAGVSPMAHPRVGGWISFFDGAETHQVSVTDQGVTLTAVETSIDVEPLGKGVAPKVSCPGTGYVAKKGETKADHPAGCWYQYKRSSAREPDDAYPVNVTAHWQVYVTYNGATERTPFNTFTKSQVTTLPVTEIESIVVP